MLAWSMFFIELSAGQVTMEVFIATMAKEVRQRYVLVVETWMQLWALFGLVWMMGMGRAMHQWQIHVQEDLLQAHAENQLEDMSRCWSHRFDARFMQILREEQRLAVEECPSCTLRNFANMLVFSSTA